MSNAPASPAAAPGFADDAARDRFYMAAALEEARLAEAAGEVPVGAVVVWNDRIIARGHNLPIRSVDPSAHAEMQALRAAAKVLGNYRMPECELYVTLEPCAMCAGAISFARIRRLYYGAADPKGGAVDHGPRLFTQPTCHHGPEVYGGINEAEAATLLREFFAARR